MALSREEIEQIAKASAKALLNKLHLQSSIYEDPETVFDGLSQSMQEEMMAAHWYRQRAEHARIRGKLFTAALYESIADEEKHHWSEFLKRREIEKGSPDETPAP